MAKSHHFTEEQRQTQMKKNGTDFSGSIYPDLRIRGEQLAKESKNLVSHEIRLQQDNTALIKLTEHANDIYSKTGQEGLEYEPDHMRHQIVRTWLHLHKPHQKEIIKHYLAIYHSNAIHTPTTSTDFLRRILGQELISCEDISNAWDLQLLEYMKDDKDNTIMEAVHDWFLSLEENICLIEWCADWKNELDIWADKHAPLGCFLTTNTKKQLPTYVTRNGKTVKPKTYWKRPMMDALYVLEVEDLIDIIKILWRNEIVGPHAVHEQGSLEYNTEALTAKEYTIHRRHRTDFMEKARKKNEDYQKRWTIEHPTDYARMIVEKTVGHRGSLRANKFNKFDTLFTVDFKTGVPSKKKQI